MSNLTVNFPRDTTLQQLVVVHRAQLIATGDADAIDLYYNGVARQLRNVQMMNALFCEWWGVNWTPGTGDRVAMLERVSSAFRCILFACGTEMYSLCATKYQSSGRKQFLRHVKYRQCSTSRCSPFSRPFMAVSISCRTRRVSACCFSSSALHSASRSAPVSTFRPG